MTALFWTELRCSYWNHSPSLGVTAPNAPNYYRDHFWLSPPTSAPFISSTADICFLFLLLLPDFTVSVDEWIYRVPSSALCQPQVCLLRLPRVTCLSGTKVPSDLKSVVLNQSQIYLPPGLWNFFLPLAAMLLYIFIATWFSIPTVPARFLVLFYPKWSLVHTQDIQSTLADLSF